MPKTVAEIDQLQNEHKASLSDDLRQSFEAYCDFVLTCMLRPY